MKQDIHRTSKNERTQLEQDFRDKASSSFRTSRKCDNTYSEALYFGQYIANKWAAVSVRTSHRYGLMQNMTKEHYDLKESYINAVISKQK